MCRTVPSEVKYRNCGHGFESWVTHRCKEATENDENCPRPLVRSVPVKTKKDGKCPTCVQKESGIFNEIGSMN